MEKIIFGILSYSCKNGKYLASIMYDSAITRDEITDAEGKSDDEETKAIQ